jgi:periplasmic protein TonB
MKILILLLLSTLTIPAIAQQKEFFYVFDANWKPTKLDSAHFFVHVHQVNDSCWQSDYYHFSGSLIKAEQYRNRERNELDGLSYHYNERGWLDSTSTYKRGKKDGDFVKMNGDSLKWQTKYVYQNDSLLEVIDLSKKSIDSSVKYADEKESEYPGGLKQWGRYLNKNLKYPERALNGNIEGEVRVFFIVDKVGLVGIPYIARSVEYSLDEESLRIVRLSGKWVPAFQNGRFVKSYKIQPIIFRLK